MKLRPRNPSPPSVDTPEPAAPVASSVQPQPPAVAAGGWEELLRDTNGEFAVYLDRGAFMWLWDLVENKAQIAERLERSGAYRGQWIEAYVHTNHRCRDAFRTSSMHDPVVQAQMRARQEALNPMKPVVVDKPKKTKKKHKKGK